MGTIFYVKLSGYRLNYTKSIAVFKHYNKNNFIKDEEFKI